MKRFRFAALILALLVLACAPALAERLGEALPDFTVQTIDGTPFTLSGALEEKDMVLINLWATWCPPCEMEFPYLEEAYEQYRDRVAVVALSVEPSDTDEALAAYAEAHGMTFPVGSDSDTGLADAFEVMSIPTSVVVDRFGNVAFVEAGAQSSAAAFTALFDYFLDDGYTETAPLEGFPQAKPAAGASEEALSAAANAEGGTLAFRNPEDESTWPMLPAREDGRDALVSSNRGIRNSGAAVRLAVTAAEGDALAFEFKTSLERAYDALYVQVDGEIVKRFTGMHDWMQWALPLGAGTHVIAMGCENLTGSTAAAQNCVWIDEVRLASGGEAEALLASLPASPTAPAAELKLADGGARRVELDDPTGVIDSAFGVGDGWIIDGESATLDAALAEGDDPETALFTTATGIERLAAESLNEDGSGYRVTVPLEAGTFDVVFLYPGVAAGDADRVLAAAVFSGEAGADAFVDYIKSYGYDAGWRYADGPEDGDAVEAAIGGEVTYTVKVVDQDGEPVPDVYVNFCTDELCELTQSDDGGVITFTGAPQAYHLQILKAPEGYRFDGEADIYTGESGGELTLQVVRE